MKLEEYLRFHIFERRACIPIYVAFRVNRFEVWMLLNFASACLLKGHKTATKKQVFDWVTGNPKIKRSINGYWFGCVNKGLLTELTMANNKTTFVMSEKGARVLDIYEARLSELESNTNKQEASKRKIKPYVLEDIKRVNIDELPHPYNTRPRLNPRVEV